MLFSLCGQVTVNGRCGVKVDIADPIPAEKNAAQELKSYLGRIFGTNGAGPHRGEGPAVILRHDAARDPRL